MGANTYSVPTSLNEGTTHKLLFIPLHDPMAKLRVVTTAKGTGDLTMTIHDINNTVVATSTILNANLSNGSSADFDLAPTYANVTLGNNYHIHFTSTIAGTTLNVTTASDITTAYYVLYYGALVYDANYHPAVTFANMIVMGNGQYIATYDGANFYPNRIQLPRGFYVRSMTKTKEFVVAACWRGTSIDGLEEGRLFYWDGVETTYNYSDTISLGLPNAVHNSKNRLLGLYGSRGMMHLGSDPFQKIQEMPQLARGKKVEIYPGAITEYQGRTMIGTSSTDDGTGLVQGVYEFGSKVNDLPDALTYAFTVSTGTTKSTSLTIGCVKSYGKDLYVSWKDGSSYGVDKISVDSTAATSGSWESLIFSGKSPSTGCLPQSLIIKFLPLASGETVTPKYRVDRAANFTSGQTVSTVGATRAEFSLTGNLQGRKVTDIEYGFDFTTTGTFLKITEVKFIYSALKEEGLEGTK